MVNTLAQHQGLESARKPTVKTTDWQYNNTGCATKGLLQQRTASAAQHTVQQLPETFHVCMYVCMYVCTYVRMHACMYVWMDGRMDAWMHGCMDAGMHGCMDACMDACMHARVYIYIFTFVCIYVGSSEPAHPLVDHHFPR